LDVEGRETGGEKGVGGDEVGDLITGLGGGREGREGEDYCVAYYYYFYYYHYYSYNSNHHHHHLPQPKPHFPPHSILYAMWQY